MAGRAEEKNNRGEHGETPNTTFPESSSECLGKRKAVVVEGAFLHAGYDPGGQDDKESHGSLHRQFGFHAEGVFMRLKYPVEGSDTQPWDNDADCGPKE
jgi:hypothetical protein